MPHLNFPSMVLPDYAVASALSQMWSTSTVAQRACQLGTAARVLRCGVDLLASGQDDELSSIYQGAS
jgi:hypothetical protein